MAPLSIVAWARRLAGAPKPLRTSPALAAPLTEQSDEEIDRSLAAAGLSRAQLFGAASATARHRVHMASMMGTLKIDAEQAVAHHWQDLKGADKVCSECGQVERCRRWLAWGCRNRAYEIFCPNAELFDEIGKEQKGE